MIGRLLAEVKEYKRDSLLTPVFMLLEVAMEMVIPLLMARIIDEGVEQGRMDRIFLVGFFMLIAAGIGLFAGIMGGKYGARASAGFAKNLRAAMFRNIQTFSFSNIDRFSSASLITRLTTDVTNIQNSYQMILRVGARAPASLVIAMTMSFYISPELAMIYLWAALILAVVISILVSITKKVFDVVFKKYDELNAGVEENVSGIRVVKAYVRPKSYRQSLSYVYQSRTPYGGYDAHNDGYGICLHPADKLERRTSYSWRTTHHRRAGKYAGILHEHSHEPYDAFHGSCNGDYLRVLRRAYHGGFK